MIKQFIVVIPFLALTMALSACQQRDLDSEATTNTQSLKYNSVAAVQLGNGNIVSQDCVKQAVSSKTSPMSCPSLSPTGDNSQLAAERGAVGERGTHSRYGWFDYYGGGYRNCYSYVNPTQFTNYCSSALGYSGSNCNSWLGYNGNNYQPTYNYQAYYNSPWNLGGNYGGWWWTR